MSATYFGILTKYGEEREAQAHALGVPLKITSLSVGDGGGIVPTPDRMQTAVIGEWRRKPLNQLYTDSANPNWLIAEQVIPEDEGGNWIRTLGLHDETGGLVAVANCAPTYKPLLAEGSGRTQVIRMVLMVGSATSFELKIDPAVVLATRKYVDDGLLSKLDKNGTAVAASKLATARTIALTGDGTASVSFDGSKNVSGALTLTASGVAAGTAGAASEIPVITVDAKGRVTVLGKVAVGNAASATKLAAARLFSMSGGATAGGASFDGSGNVNLIVTALDVSKASAGILPVSRGGTGLGTLPSGSYLIGAGADMMAARTPAQVLEDVQALPLAGGTLTGPVLLGAGGAIGAQYGVNSAAARTAHVLLPDGGGYSSHLASVVGAMKITLPSVALAANTMMRLRVDIFEYQSDAPPVSILLHGYAQSSKAWARCGATVVAGAAASDIPVRFGSDASGNLCIWLGDLTKSWSYPVVTVAEVLAKYHTAGATLAGWGAGWKVEPVTALDTVSQTLASGNLAFGRADIARVAGLQDALDLKANAAVSFAAGNGLSGGGTLGANRSFSLGTPGTLSAASTNAVQSTSHTHALDTQTAPNDATAGRILTVGNAFGIGADNPLGTIALNTVKAPGLYGQSSSANATPARNYPVSLAGSLLVGSAGPDITTHAYSIYHNGDVYTRAGYKDVWSDWQRVTRANDLATTMQTGLIKLATYDQAAAGSDSLTAMTPYTSSVSINARIATEALAQAGTDNARLLTPYLLGQAFGGGNSRLESIGFQRLPGPGKLIVQWGFSAGYESYTVIPFIPCYILGYVATCFGSIGTPAAAAWCEVSTIESATKMQIANYRPGPNGGAITTPRQVQWVILCAPR